MINESIPADALANETYLFFDKSIFDVIIDNDDLTSATLTIGPSGDSRVVIDNIHEFQSLDALIQEITNSAAWATETDITWTTYIESHFMPGYGHDGMDGEVPHDTPEGNPPMHAEDGDIGHNGDEDINQDHQDIQNIQLVMHDEEDIEDRQSEPNTNETDNTGGVPINGAFRLMGVFKTGW